MLLWRAAGTELSLASVQDYNSASLGGMSSYLSEQDWLTADRQGPASGSEADAELSA
jgi:hypothetical protein